MAVYERTYELTSCHFNGDAVYKDYYAAQEAAKAGDFTKAYALLQAVLPACHGHNFKVKITVQGKLDASGYVIDDYALEKMIRKFDNVNLSTLEEFGGAGIRATTENLAELFYGLITMTWRDMRFVRVEVWETSQIMAARGDSVVSGVGG